MRNASTGQRNTAFERIVEWMDIGYIGWKRRTIPKSPTAGVGDFGEGIVEIWKWVDKSIPHSRKESLNI